MVKHKRTYQAQVGRIPVVVLLTPTVYRIIQTWAADERRSVSAVVSGMLHAGLEIPEPAKRSKRRRARQS